MPTITILTPLYNESETLERLLQEIDSVASSLTAYRFDIVLVDDGSTDQTVAIAEKLATERDDITLIELSKNFGKEIALTAGIQELNCDAAVIMDADLQHPPEVIPQLVEQWEAGFEIVATRRSSIEGRPFLKRMGSKLFYKLINMISETDMQSQTTDFRLLDKVVIHHLKLFTERNRMVRGLIDWMGFRKSFVDFAAPERAGGDAGYTYLKLIRLAMNGITSFSLFPLRIAGYFGILITLVFGLLFVWMIIDKLWMDVMQFSSIAFVIVSNSFLIGLVLICLGLIALYIGNIHTEVTNRPLFIVRRVVKSGKSPRRSKKKPSTRRKTKR